MRHGHTWPASVPPARWSPAPRCCSCWPAPIVVVPRLAADSTRGPRHAGHRPQPAPRPRTRRRRLVAWPSSPPRLPDSPLRPPPERRCGRARRCGARLARRDDHRRPGRRPRSPAPSSPARAPGRSRAPPDAPVLHTARGRDPVPVTRRHGQLGHRRTSARPSTGHRHARQHRDRRGFDAPEHRQRRLRRPQRRRATGQLGARRSSHRTPARSVSGLVNGATEGLGGTLSGAGKTLDVLLGGH